MEVRRGEGAATAAPRALTSKADAAALPVENRRAAGRCWLAVRKQQQPNGNGRGRRSGRRQGQAAGETKEPQCEGGEALLLQSACGWALQLIAMRVRTAKPSRARRPALGEGEARAAGAALAGRDLCLGDGWRETCSWHGFAAVCKSSDTCTFRDRRRRCTGRDRASDVPDARALALPGAWKRFPLRLSGNGFPAVSFPPNAPQWKRFPRVSCNL